MVCTCGLGEGYKCEDHDMATEPKKLRGNRCQCAACGEYFKSTFAFDKHRVGPHSDRRCLGPIAMREFGMAQKPDGFWVSALMEVPA